MWSAQVNRRELFEIYLGSTKLLGSRVREAAQVGFSPGSDVVLVWGSDPTVRYSLPSLVIVAQEVDVQSILSAIAASPQAPSPISALSRVVTQGEARHHFDEDMLPLDDRLLPALVVLTFIEAVLRGDGRLGVRHLTPLICKRTFSYAWGKALSARAGPDSFVDLPSRWLEMYGALNTPPLLDTAQRTIDAVIKALSLAGQLALGLCPDGAPEALAFELLNGSKDSQEEAWQRLSQRQVRPVTLDELQALAREERASYLQNALRLLNDSIAREPKSGHSQDDMVATCAFLATRLAPGSLEHLDVLGVAGRGDVLAWYGLYAALQSPKEMMSLFGGLGYRVLRDLGRAEEKLAAPSADIAYSEFRVLARGGLETLAGRLGHASELQVEVVPYVCTSFTFQPRRGTRLTDSQQSLDMDRPEMVLPPRIRVAQLAAELAELAKELPNGNDDIQPKRVRRR